MDLDQLGVALAAASVLSPTSFPVHHLEVFLFVASKGHCTYEEIQEELNLSNSTVSRTVHSLGFMHRKGYEGLGLFNVDRDPKEGRRFLVSLSDKGQRLKRQLELI
jgi:DNA-binding MarR family transcriptional regulator